MARWTISYTGRSTWDTWTRTTTVIFAGVPSGKADMGYLVNIESPMGFSGCEAYTGRALKMRHVKWDGAVQQTVGLTLAQVKRQIDNFHRREARKAKSGK